MTDVTNFQICSTCSVDLILFTISVTDNHLFKLASDMVSGTTVCIPVGVNPIPRGSNSCKLGLVLIIVVIIVVPTVAGFMASLLQDLAGNPA